MVLDAAMKKIPAYLDTGLNIVHVDDVAKGHLQAFDNGKLGERYILGGENYNKDLTFCDFKPVSGIFRGSSETHNRKY